MYWIYLVIFVLIVLTPKVIQEGVFFLQEGDVEALIIFCFGMFGFVLYLFKEKALLRIIQEKLHLQKKTNIITKDLSDSYSYIGEMNRKFDIVKNLIFNLPKHTADIVASGQQETYQAILQATKLLAKTEFVALYFVDMRTKKIEAAAGNHASRKMFAQFDGETLAAAQTTFWETDHCVVVRSPKRAEDMAAFLIFPKERNFVEDREIFKMLSSQALLLFCLERCRTNTKDVT